jgi:predicted acylesterase/phospholipase RssA
MRTALLVLAAAVLLPGCGRRHCVPRELSERKYIDLSAAADAHAPVGTGRLREIEAEFNRRAAAAAPPARPYHYLALSGGGLYGSFGVGVLAGWTESGTRPEFDAVTGISTGALMATFAFLGPGYDAALYDAMVGVTRRDLLAVQAPVRIPITDAIFNSRPMVRRIERYITPEVVAEVAAAHAAGRRLYIGTTNLDSRRLVLWDMGAIATRGTPEAVALYRKILLASASIPGAFPPVRVPVEVDGRRYEELHVDGGASDEVVFRPFMVADLNRANGLPGAVAPAGSVLYVVNNGRLYSEPDCVSPRLFSLVSASLRSVIYGKTRDELYRIYLNCLETGVAFRATAVPEDFTVGAGGLAVSLDDQRRLYESGVAHGRVAGAGEGWRDLPAGAETNEQAMPRTGTRFVTVPR